MKPNLDLVKLTFCGPGDVAKELALARSVIDRWNLQHGEARGFWIKVHHWSTDCHPALGDRPQAIVNGQIVDESDILVAIFWSRFGTPTGLADSGTQEEIRRGVRLKKKVMVYFSDLEPLPPEARTEQTEKVWTFRQELRSDGLCWSFASRTQFERLFESHLTFALNELRPSPKPPAAPVTPAMSIVGDGNTQVGGDYNVNQVIKKVIERRDGSLTSAECRQVQEMIKALVDLTTGLTLERAFASWWDRLKNRFKVEKYESLLSTQMPEVEGWYREHRAILTSGLKTKAPELWKNARIGSIKKAMKKMNREADKLDYYLEISDRLNMKRPFTSLTKLTKTDLDRVYRLVLRDAGD
ncbi:MAG TPA: hypothetical protein VG838_02420 [Opitutaceae bacterium]|nr:hypothetical protein [Opitutaceae bacterium]